MRLQIKYIHEDDTLIKYKNATTRSHVINSDRQFGMFITQKN